MLDFSKTNSNFIYIFFYPNLGKIYDNGHDVDDGVNDANAIAVVSQTTTTMAMRSTTIKTTSTKEEEEKNNERNHFDYSNKFSKKS